MNSNRPGDENKPSNHVQAGSKKSYNFLLRLSGDLGKVATQSFVEVKQFLNTEIPMPQMPHMSQTERLLNNVPYLKRWVDNRKNEENEQPVKKLKLAKPVAKPNEGIRREVDLKKIVEQSHEVLASSNTVFPVSLFPDTVVVDRTKVTITRRNFFWSSDVMSIRIEDVLNVSASVGPLFGSLTVASRVMSTIDHFRINFFWRNDAIHLKHIIQGYVIAQHNNIDTAHLSKDELIKTLEELGQDFNV